MVDEETKECTREGILVAIGLMISAFFDNKVKRAFSTYCSLFSDGSRDIDFG